MRLSGRCKAFIFYVLTYASAEVPNPQPSRAALVAARRPEAPDPWRIERNQAQEFACWCSDNAAKMELRGDAQATRGREMLHRLSVSLKNREKKNLKRAGAKARV